MDKSYKGRVLTNCRITVTKGAVELRTAPISCGDNWPYRPWLLGPDVAVVPDAGCVLVLGAGEKAEILGELSGTKYSVEPDQVSSAPCSPKH